MNLEQAASAFRSRLDGFDGFWCVAGGWAIDLFLNRQTRGHEDLEIVVLRSEFQKLHRQFQNLEPKKIFSGDPPKFVSWTGEEIEDEVIQVRLNPIEGCEFDLLLTPSDGNNWICRRSESIQLPLSQVVVQTKSGLPVLSPEIVLLFKAKYVRSKDESDFDNVIGLLSHEARGWFETNLAKIHPDHSWLSR